MGRLLVHIPVVVSAFRCIGSSAPEALLVERDAFGLDGAHDVSTQVAIADGQGDSFPFHGVAGAPGILVDMFGSSLPEFLLAVVPGKGTLQRGGGIKPDGKRLRSLVGRGLHLGLQHAHRTAEEWDE